MDQIQSDNAGSPPLNQNLISSEPDTLLSQQNTTALPTVVRRNNRLKSRKTVDVGSCNRKNHYKRQEKRTFTLDSYTYYHPQSNIYSRSDYKYERYCRAYEPHSPDSLIKGRVSPKYPIYGYSTSLDDKLYDSPSTKLYPNSNIFMGSEVNNEKNSEDSENSESGKEITKMFLYDFEAWRET
ncbi:4870_t:CDS:1, partial [Gigaspora rosea]